MVESAGLLNHKKGKKGKQGKKNMLIKSHLSSLATSDRVRKPNKLRNKKETCKQSKNLPSKSICLDSCEKVKEHHRKAHVVVERNIYKIGDNNKKTIF